MSVTTENPFTVEVRELPAQPTAVVHATTSQEGMPQELGRIYGLVRAAIEKRAATLAGPPFARYHTFAEPITFEAGFPVTAPIEPDGEVVPGELPAGPAAVYLHLGPYDTLAGSYAALEAWREREGHRPAGAMWECYLTSPSEVPDPRAWRTEMYMPLARS